MSTPDVFESVVPSFRFNFVIDMHAARPKYTSSAAAIWSFADIVYIAIYRDVSKISRYCIAIFLKSISNEQLFVVFTQFTALLWWRPKNQHINHPIIL